VHNDTRSEAFRINRDQSDSFFQHTHISLNKKSAFNARSQRNQASSRESMKKPLWAQKLHYRAQNCNSRRNENAFVAAAALKIAINYERRPKCSHADALTDVRASF